MELQSTYGKDGFKLDVRTKLLVMVMVNMSVFTGDLWYALVLAAAIPLSLLIFTKKYRAATTCIPLYAASLLCHFLLVDKTPGAINIIIVMLCGVVVRMIPGIILGYFLFSTTTVSEFVAAMERIHLPKQIIIPFSVMFRFFPTIKEESASINDAMKMRGVAFGKTRGGPVALLEYRLVPLFISCVKIGEELSSSALTRGLGSPVKRTNICEIGFHIQDVIYLSLAVAAFAMFILL